MRRLLRRTAPKGSMLNEDASVLGIDPKLLGQESEDDAFVLWAENAAVFDLFEYCQGSWRTGALGGLLGLDKGDVKATAEILGMTLDRQSLRDLTLCETVFIAEANSRQKRGKR